MLGARSSWLDKADGGDLILTARLAPDMFPLSTQVRFACVQALGGVHRLSAQPIPPSVAMLLEEGRKASQEPGTISDAKARIAETIDLVQSAAGAAELPIGAAIVHELPQGMIFDLSARQDTRDWALPHVYFHVMTAYTILRAQGVALGKADYVAHMFALLRPDC
jgi:uncharacterized protein